MNNTSRLLIYLSFLWALLILALGGWWLYLLVKFDKQLSSIGGPGVNTVSLVKWEGGTFLVLLLFLSGTILFYFLKDQQKNKAMQAFFASLTHELKTPLASVRLQAEVIHDLLAESDDQRLRDLSERLIEDGQKLETQMDKVLQLSRIERGGNLNPVAVPLVPFIERTCRQWGKELELELSGNNVTVMADEFALELILRNLIENTRVHSGDTFVRIKIIAHADTVEVIYSDAGTFLGDPTKLGTLFYKHNSSKGSGIGLYLISRLLLRMGGGLKIATGPLAFHLFLPTQGERA